LIINGLVLVFASIYMPQGIAGALGKLRNNVGRTFGFFRGGK
jgi:hypothetical protein